MAGRRTSLATLAGQKVDDVPGKSDPLLMSLPLDKLVPTRFNPRRRFGTDDELREFGEKLTKKQLQPAVVVSRTAYLKLWPEEAEHLGTASYVIANGERRYRASRLVGRAVLEVVHKEDIAQSRADFLDAVQSENNDRENLDPIERALGIDIMVAQLGGADQVAVYYRKTKGWVSQQRKLLRLTAELQDLVSAGEMPIRVARDIAGLPAEVQMKAWEEELERRRLEKEASARLRTERAQRFTAVNQPTPLPALNPAPVPAPNPQADSGGAGDSAGRNDAPMPSGPATAPDGGTGELSRRDNPAPPPPARPTPAQPAVSQDDRAVPEQRAESLVEHGPWPEGRKLPYDEPVHVAWHLFHRMTDADFVTALTVMADITRGKYPHLVNRAVPGESE